MDILVKKVSTDIDNITEYTVTKAGEYYVKVEVTINVGGGNVVTETICSKPSTNETDTKQ